MAAEVTCPYVGLVPYTEEDAKFFFGRERETRQVVANLFASRLTLLYGASGVGKSSVLRAGVLHELEGRAARGLARGEAPEQLAVYLKDWQGDVVSRLRGALRRALARSFPDAGEVVPQGAELSDVLAAVSEGLEVDLLVILDQFEEYFLYHGDEGVDDVPFAQELAAAVNRPGLSASFLVSLRDDALARLDRFKARIPRLFSNYLRLRPLAGAAARSAIVEPVAVWNQLPAARDGGPVRLESELVAAVVEEVRRGRVRLDAGGRGGATEAETGIEAPFLQLVMTRVWEEELGSGSRALRAGTLEGLGGAAAIVGGHLDRVMGELDGEEHEICGRIFQHLVTPSGAKIAHTAADLAGLAEVEPERMERLLSRISGSGMRILAPVAPADAVGAVRYEIYHDALAQAMLEWRRRWVEEREREELEAEAERQRLELLKERRTARRLRWLAAGLAVFMVLALAAMGFAWFQMDRVEKLATQLQGAVNALDTLRQIGALGLEPFEIPGLEMRFVPVPAGPFQMGSPADEVERHSDETLHQVEITRPFWMAETEVTQGQWRSLMGNNPSGFSACGDDCPVERVNWFEAAAFANRLSEREGLQSCYELGGCEKEAGEDMECKTVTFVGLDCPGYRLPTEAEWESAARAGTTTPFWTGENLTTEQANYDGNYPYAGQPKGEYREKTVAVRSFAPNLLGLYEVHGNVWEWVQDWFGPYPAGSVTDPTGPERGAGRVYRGGGWGDFARYCRAAYRLASPPGNRYDDLGFRLVRTLPSSL